MTEVEDEIKLGGKGGLLTGNHYCLGSALLFLSLVLSLSLSLSLSTMTEVEDESKLGEGRPADWQPLLSGIGTAF